MKNFLIKWSTLIGINALILLLAYYEQFTALKVIGYSAIALVAAVAVAITVYIIKLHHTKFDTSKINENTKIIFGVTVNEN